MLLSVLLLLSGCAYFTPLTEGRRAGGGDGPHASSPGSHGDNGEDGDNGAGVERERLERRESGPSSPVLAEPEVAAGRAIWREALAASGQRIVISVDHRWLWLMDGGDVLFSAPVAVGTNEPFSYAGRRYDFKTPRSKWRVLKKDRDRLWVPPNWHYYEVAVKKDLRPVQLARNDRVVLSDSTIIEVRGDQVGRINRFGNWWPFTPGSEIIFDGKVFIPPIGTRQRQIPEILGTHALELGDGYLIHGTNEEDSIGEAVSHGCVRMYNEDVAVLYDRVATGTPVYIY